MADFFKGVYCVKGGVSTQLQMHFALLPYITNLINIALTAILALKFILY